MNKDLKERLLKTSNIDEFNELAAQNNIKKLDAELTQHVVKLVDYGQTYDNHYEIRKKPTTQEN